MEPTIQEIFIQLIDRDNLFKAKGELSFRIVYMDHGIGIESYIKDENLLAVNFFPYQQIKQLTLNYSKDAEIRSNYPSSPDLTHKPDVTFLKPIPNDGTPV